MKKVAAVTAGTVLAGLLLGFIMVEWLVKTDPPETQVEVIERAELNPTIVNTIAENMEPPVEELIEDELLEDEEEGEESE
ncbi:hypothetical protein ACFPU1_02860 [Thalassorhabdus alkalitolerans]|uniref:Uncharacterized protein n=1 Tax=Thalassorhabdus alkalitolerans TaxID=2282697 RepID=A0ABW0YH08_9BACI|nr:hypothetical protein [Thalassobacillus sp. C254]